MSASSDALAKPSPLVDIGPARPSLLALVGFGMGSLGTGLFSTVPSFLLLYYMTEILRVDPALAGLAVFAPKILGIVTDPLMGRLSDKTRSRLGRRRPYLLAGGLLLPSLFILLFNVPAQMTELANFTFVLIVYALSATAYTIFSVPYLAMPSEFSTDPHVRTEILSYRMIFVMVGIMLGMAAAPALVDFFGSGRHGYAMMALVIGVICGVAMLTSFFATRGLAQRATDDRPSRMFADVVAAVRNANFRALMGTYGLQIVGASLFGAIAPYFVADILRQSLTQMGVMFLTMLSAAIVAMPLWTMAARRLGKKPTLASAAVLYALAAAALYVLPSGTFGWQVLVPVAFLGVAFGGIQLLPFSILTDVIHEHGLSTASWQEGTFTGIWTAAEKAALAIGPLIAGGVLHLTGFAASGSAQPPQAIEAIRELFGIVPAFLFVASALVLRTYRPSRLKA